MLEALVTGSTGFIGSHLAEALLERGFNVRCLLRKGKSNERYIKDLNVEKFYIDDYNESEIKKSRVLDGINYVFHTAGVTKGITMDDFLAGNEKPTRELLAAIKSKKQNLQRFVFLSSSAVAGCALSLDEPIRRDDHSCPVERYGKSKFAGEQAVKQSKVPFTIIRPGGVYGPRDVDYFNLFKSIHGHINPFFGIRKKYHSIVHVKDLVEATIGSISIDKTQGQTYFICNNKPVSWQKLQSIIKSATGKKFIIPLYLPEFFLDIAAFFGEWRTKRTGKFSLLNKQKAKLAKQQYLIYSNMRARMHFGFEPEISLEQGVKETYRWYLENKWLK